MKKNDGDKNNVTAPLVPAPGPRIVDVDAIRGTTAPFEPKLTNRAQNATPLSPVGQATLGRNDSPRPAQYQSGLGQAHAEADAVIAAARAAAPIKPARWIKTAIEKIPAVGWVNWHEETWETDGDGTPTCIEIKVVRRMSRGEALERLMLANTAIITQLA